MTYKIMHSPKSTSDLNLPKRPMVELMLRFIPEEHSQQKYNTFLINLFNAKSIFSRKQKKKKVLLGIFIATSVFIPERKILSSSFFSQLIELFYRTIKK